MYGITCTIAITHKHACTVACGVAHQALEGIEPQGQDILIQGTLLTEIKTLSYCIRASVLIGSIYSVCVL